MDRAQSHTGSLRMTAQFDSLRLAGAKGIVVAQADEPPISMNRQKARYLLLRQREKGR